MKTGKHLPYKRSKQRGPAIAMVIIIPFAIALVMFYYIFGPGLMDDLATRGDDRLTTDGWQSAQSDMAAAQPAFGTKYSYYKMAIGQNLQWAARHFGVSLAELQKLNPGKAVGGTTIKVVPVEAPLAPIATASKNMSNISVGLAKNGVLTVNNPFTSPTVDLTVPRLMQLTRHFGAITQVGPKNFILNKPLYVQGNIRTDITSATVKDLYLRSDPDYKILTLTFQDSEALIDGVRITSYDSKTKGPDANYKDGRSFLRAYGSARMDVLDSTISYLGMTKDQAVDPKLQSKLGFISQGGVYGVSWRISSGRFGVNDTTGWVEKSTFIHNYIGAFTFGAQGMMWRNNLFTKNTVYGLDPHDDSNNATVEYNRFVANGKHGFIVSKRCDYNVIKDNISINNKLHGFMLHDNSDYNIFEHNISIGNFDNFALYQSSFNMIADNKGYNPRGSQVRINLASIQNYINNNFFYGGQRGIYLYGNDNGVAITNNTFDKVNYQLNSDGATRVLFTGNISNNLGYKLKHGDRVVFGINKIYKHPASDLQPLATVDQGLREGTPLEELAVSARRQ